MTRATNTKRIRKALARPTNSPELRMQVLSRGDKQILPTAIDLLVGRRRDGEGWDVIDRKGLSYATGFDTQKEAFEWIEGQSKEPGK